MALYCMYFSKIKTLYCVFTLFAFYLTYKCVRSFWRILYFVILELIHHKVKVWRENFLSYLLRQIQSNLSIYSLYYSEACNEFSVLISGYCVCGQHSSFQSNVAAVAGC